MSFQVADDGSDQGGFQGWSPGLRRPFFRQSFAALRAPKGLRNDCINSFGENYFHRFKGRLRHSRYRTWPFKRSTCHGGTFLGARQDAEGIEFRAMEGSDGTDASTPCELWEPTHLPSPHIGMRITPVHSKGESAQ